MIASAVAQFTGLTGDPLSCALIVVGINSVMFLVLICWRFLR